MPSDALSAPQSDPTLPEIIQRLRDWRQSFATIRIVWHEWCRADILAAHPELDSKFDPDGKYHSRLEFAWADWGAFRVETIEYNDGRPYSREMEGTDGMRPWSAITGLEKDADIQKWEMIQFWKPDPARPLGWNVTWGGTYGLWKSDMGWWLDEHLARAESVVLQRYEDLDGHRCALVKMSFDRKKIPSFSMLPGATWIMEEDYWLDVDHAFLPRKCRVTSPNMTKDGRQVEGRHHCFTWKVEDFRRVEDRVWFPARGTTRVGTEDPKGRDTKEWVIKDVKLNESLPRSFFQAVQPSPGTQVIDYANRSGYRAPGGGQDAPRSESRAPDAPVGESNVRAEVRSFPWRWLGLVAALATGAGLALRWRPRCQAND